MFFSVAYLSLTLLDAVHPSVCLGDLGHNLSCVSMFPPNNFKTFLEPFCCQ